MAPSSFFSSIRACAIAALLAFSGAVQSVENIEALPPPPTQAVGGATVQSTILIVARDNTSALNSGYVGLQGYGIPYEVVTIPQSGGKLPVLNSTATTGNYGGIVVVSEVAYDYNGSYYSAMTRAQWNSLYNYQISFGVRMVRLDVVPSADFGTQSLGGNAKDEPVTFTNATGFPTASLKTNANVSIANIYHYPAKIVNSSIAWEVAKFGSTGTAAVVNQLAGGRQQMVWFMPFALDWSASSTYLQHAWIHWVTRGLYVGFRRLYFSTQVDDMFLETPLYTPNGSSYRVKSDDLTMHVDWQSDINTRMPKGSEYFLEIGHNGNGDIEAATDTTQGSRSCSPSSGIEYPDQTDGPPDYTKPMGSGTDLWPATPTKYGWSLDCAEIDDLQNWFETDDNLNSFAHISHTFTHEDLTNATYADTAKEISFNQAWLSQVGIASAQRFSSKGIIPPAITGLHNGDALKAWLDNGIVNVVGDNTRPLLLDTENRFWPLTSNVAKNGYDGVLIMPRWATTIYYNCDLPACTLAEWINTSGGKGTFDDLIKDAKNTATRNLLGLHWDPYMFHQANLRVNDVPETTVNGVKGQYSLLMTWTEVMVTEIMRLTTWPFKTIKHDDLAQQFINRKTRDLCKPILTWKLSADGKSIENITVGTGSSNQCATTIPVTVPGSVTSTTGATKEQLGSDPLTLWVTMSGTSRSYTLSKALAV